jgi:hypothetical protein
MAVPTDQQCDGEASVSAWGVEKEEVRVSPADCVQHSQDLLLAYYVLLESQKMGYRDAGGVRRIAGGAPYLGSNESKK